MPGTGSINLASAESFRDYVEDFGTELFGRAYYGFESANIATLHEGVKGKKILTELIMGDLARRWAKNFTPTEDQLNFKPRTLEVSTCKVELQICPQDFESTYLGMFRRKGQNHDDIPFEGYILDKIMKKLAQEFEVAFHQAQKAGTPAAADLMKQTFDGLNKVIADEIAAGYAPVATPGGTLTATSIIPTLEAMWNKLSDAYKPGEIEVYGSYAHTRLYQTAYAAKYNGNKPAVDAMGRVRLEFGEGWLKPLPGRSGSDRLIMTPSENLHYGIDAPEDSQIMKFENNKRNVDMWMDFNVGLQVGLVDEDVFVVNDLV